VCDHGLGVGMFRSDLYRSAGKNGRKWYTERSLVHCDQDETRCVALALCATTEFSVDLLRLSGSRCKEKEHVY
jgi:hypothetical protein